MELTIRQKQMSGFIYNSLSLQRKVATELELHNKSTVLLVLARIIMELHAFLALPHWEILLSAFCLISSGLYIFRACFWGNLIPSFFSLTLGTNFAFNFALQLRKTWLFLSFFRQSVFIRFSCERRVHSHVSARVWILMTNEKEGWIKRVSNWWGKCPSCFASRFEIQTQFLIW